MLVRVRLKGPLASLAGEDELFLELEEGADVLTALRTLCERQKGLSRAIFDLDTGDPRTNTLVLLDGKDVDVLGGLTAPLSDGSVLTLIPLIRL